MTTFELAVQDEHGIDVANRLAADRLELCSALPLGGVTPSLGLIEAAVAARSPSSSSDVRLPDAATATRPGGVPVHVLVRPRPGGFEYTPAEVATTVRDVRHAVAAGAAGVVIGGLRDGHIDSALVDRVVAAADGAEVTFHRAFDLLADPIRGIEELIGLGVRRILTAGCPTVVADGLPGLRHLVTAASGRVEIQAGGGVSPALIPALLATGVPAVHASAKTVVPDSGTLTLGSAATGPDAGRETTDERTALRLIEALRTAGSRP
ncbi:copper homeostasis protein CutC [Actinoplanes couchii]|uniref:PF03932 family protein CutC n=1 Tax=Actinoplanes couchii TaxID=403638 RepID=A0ABQ3X204_9ACTN|nr:copper homeostasis protein CutC [Actinoplanes couchii]MDR6316833.1 copper homeostasis protein [Actinoplanes couchii]GID52440.1 copper homeostasis protein CutC [Actinoplanes couchii]